MDGRRIKADRRGGYRLALPEEEREILRELPQQLRELLGTDDPSLRRLFPPAYDDTEADEEYGTMVRESLLDEKLAALAVVERTADATHLDDAELDAWLNALETLRLVLGTQLDVTEETSARAVDPRDPTAPALALYAYLSWLQEEAVSALAAGLP